MSGKILGILPTEPVIWKGDQVSLSVNTSFELIIYLDQFASEGLAESSDQKSLRPLHWLEDGD
ncbi:hypothetical protein M3P05_07695 [Sansalvadorimonas sp. 2012CJ34-2]|uniref:Uncharacterized protein n=1 Tax=Parendozoicomonas callyspongiae TaxID=2942213 RepID=A0ABT0PEL4_9GAMM|nr:hypothetical protein [Sansalvadorimonas sp. 2012CJ34-2]MCL6269822.1 hypothetical protein [Sansalvadorimonas sp. 2012CJ34-2]